MPRKRIATLAALATLLAASSCTGCYYGRLAYGQAKILVGRESIEEALAGDALTAEEKAKLALVPKVRAFAAERLGLARTGSYTTFYDTGSQPISWNVTACEATAFRPVEWVFPFVGAASYKGFFQKELADAEAERLRGLGYDVVVREVSAYSTLGWFDDPVFRRMLSRDVHDLASTIIHELVHATVFRSGDQAFNESVATFIGNEGALAFLEAEFGRDSAELRVARDTAADEEVFTGFIDSLYDRLDGLYRSGAPESEKRERRDRIFASARGDFEALRAAKMRVPGAYGRFAKRPLNNAVILGYRSYHTDLAGYADVLDLCGGDFKSAVAVFREAAEDETPQTHLTRWCALARAGAQHGKILTKIQ